MARHEQFSIEKLPLVDNGRAAAMFNHALEVAVRDCQDRPGDKSKRKVTFDVYLSPSEIDQDTVDLEFECGVKVPKLRARPVAMSPHHNGALAFHPDLPDDPHGSSLFDGESSDREV